MMGKYGVLVLLAAVALGSAQEAQDESVRYMHSRGTQCAQQRTGTRAPSGSQSTQCIGVIAGAIDRHRCAWRWAREAACTCVIWG